jgi:ABC-2 type transport system permease protein
MPKLKVIKGFFIKEIIQVFRDKKLTAMIFFVPLLQLTLFGLALTNEVKNISILCVYAPEDSLSRQVEERLLASKWFIPAKQSKDLALTSAIVKRDAEAVLIMPPEGLSKALERNEADMQLLIDAANSQRAVQIENYVKNIAAQTISAHYGLEPQSPLNMNINILYNPSLESAFYMIPAIMGFVLCILTVLITGMSLAKEKEFGTFEKLISSPATASEILLGKTIPYVFLAFIAAPLIIFAGMIFFDLPVRGGLLKLLIVCLCFIVSSCSIAVFISTLAKTQQQIMMGSLMFLFPSLLLSGLIFPVENIPLFARWLSYINPLYYFLSLLRNIILKGGDLGFMLKNCSALLAIGATLAFISFKKFNDKLN